MKRVLLAINGDIPTNPIFQYAVGLCRRISADLDILQLKKAKKILSSTKKKVGSLGRFMEDSFAGAAFAEEGMPQMADEILSGISGPLRHLLQEDNTGVSCSVSLTEGPLETELSTYVENHKDIVLTVFDPSCGKDHSVKKDRRMVRALRKKLSVPLVVVDL